MKKLTRLAAAGLIGAGMAATTGASATSVSGTLFAGLNQLSDNSGECLINVGQTECGVGDTTVDIGDRLRGIFTIETVEDLSSGGGTRLLGTGGNQELTGIFDIVVTAKLGGGGGPATYEFEASGGLASLTGVSADAMVAFFIDDDYEYTRLDDTVANLEANVTNGDLYWTFGLDGVDDYWTAFSVTDDIAAIGDNGSSTGGFFNLGLSFLVNNSGLEFNEIGCIGDSVVDACGTGNLLGTSGANTPYDSFNNVDFTLNRVPVPAPLALMSLGLLALGGLSRRKRA